MNSPAAEVARVADAPITIETVRQTIARQGYNIYEEASAKQALDDAIRFELLAAEARKLGLDRDPVIVQQLKQWMVEKLVAEKIDAALKATTFTDDELRAWYDANVNEFTKPTIARGAVLTVFITEGRTKEAKARADEALGRLGSGERFETVVRQYSDDPAERISGGATSWLAEAPASRRYPPEVVTAMLALQRPGEVGGPVPTAKAFYLVTLAEKRLAQTTPFEAAKNEVRQRLYRERRQQALDAYCETLRKEFPVTLNEAELKKAVEPTTPNSGPPMGPVELK
ncbi:MAG: peptidyl-prolyl cis-trans isomerase [Verrucomicrobia bacterium]|nr:peptidyl-prolyl cis-trans isomerase [Verrucomicrobiota bacterium]